VEKGESREGEKSESDRFLVNSQRVSIYSMRSRQLILPRPTRRKQTGEVLDSR